MAENSSSENIGIVEVDGLPYVLAVILCITGGLGMTFALLCIVGYLRVGIEKQGHVVVYVVIAGCCILSSMNAVSVAVGMFSYTWIASNDTSTDLYENVLCVIQSSTSDFPRVLIMISYLIGMCGRVIATYAPLEYYRYFKYGVVMKLSVLGAILAGLGLTAEIFAVSKDYAENVGVCASSSDSSYATVHLICTALTKIISFFFLVAAYVSIIRKYVKNRVNVAGNLSDDASKGIIIAAGSYGVLSVFLPQQLLVVLYLMANITIGVYMMKERNITSSESMHNKETFFFLRLSLAYIVVLGLSCSYYCAYIFYHVQDQKAEADILHSEYNALILFYIREVAFTVVSLVNMVQMWKHTYELRERLTETFMQGLQRRGTFNLKFTEGSKFGAYLKMNNIKIRKPALFKRKRKLVRKDGKLYIEKRRKYVAKKEERLKALAEDDKLQKLKTEDAKKTNSFGRTMSLKRLGSKKSPKKDDDKAGRKGEISIRKKGSERKRAPGNRKESRDHGIREDPVDRV